MPILVSTTARVTPDTGSRPDDSVTKNSRPRHQLLADVTASRRAEGEPARWRKTGVRLPVYCGVVMASSLIRISRPIATTASVLVVAALLCGACGGAVPQGSGRPSTSSVDVPSPGSSPSTPLAAPKTSIAQDGRFFTSITEADPALGTYEQKDGNVALRALLTDGSAFCALLVRDGSVDRALVDVAVGARSGEAQTQLPLSVTTFNAIEGVALVTLCPSEQKLLPPSDRATIRRLGTTLDRQSP